jgi:hypothetical protein
MVQSLEDKISLEAEGCSLEAGPTLFADSQSFGASPYVYNFYLHTLQYA